MKKKMYASICIAISMLLVVSVGSVIGTDQSNLSTLTIIESPLFSTQTDRFTDSTMDTIGTAFIGMDSKASPFGFSTHNIQTGFEKALTLLRKHPQILTKILPALCKHEAVEPILKEHNIELADIQHQIMILQKNPVMFQEIVEQDLQGLSLHNPSSLGLNSTNPFAILIVIFALLPLLVTLVLIIATATIITCFNIAGCFETIFNGIVYGFINGLEPA